MDHRPPPLDHRALDVGGARRGGMDHVAQRGGIVFPARRLRQFHQPDEHGRHHEHGVDAFGLDQPQKRLGVEARHQHQRAAQSPGAQAERIRRRMIKRSRQQRPHARFQAIDQRTHPFRGYRLLRRRRLAPHPLGMACGAGSVDHVLRLRPRRTVIGRLPGEPGFEIDGETGRGQMIGIDPVMRSDFRRRRDAEHGDAGRDRAAAAGAAGRHGRSAPRAPESLHT